MPPVYDWWWSIFFEEEGKIKISDDLIDALKQSDEEYMNTISLRENYQYGTDTENNFGLKPNPLWSLHGKTVFFSQQLFEKPLDPVSPNISQIVQHAETKPAKNY